MFRRQDLQLAIQMFVTFSMQLRDRTCRWFGEASLGAGAAWVHRG
jgi:hypothetical protein